MTKFYKTFSAIGLVVFMGLFLFSCKKETQLPDPLQAGWKGKKVCSILEENKKIRTLKCTFPPGVGHEKHFHASHFGYTLQGSTFKITDAKGSREVHVPSGYHFYNEKIKWHQVVNVGDSTAVFLIIEPK